MSLLSKRGLLERIRRGKGARARLVESNLAKGIAYQIRATRERQEMKQADLAAAAGMTPNNLSRLESPDYGKHTISSLRRIADALDVALVVRFVPFTQYIDWLSGTSFLDEGLRPEALAVASFQEEEEAKNFDTVRKYWSVVSYASVGTNVPVCATTYTPTIKTPTVKTVGAYSGRQIWSTTSTSGAYLTPGKAS